MVNKISTIPKEQRARKELTGRRILYSFCLIALVAIQGCQNKPIPTAPPTFTPRPTLTAYPSHTPPPTVTVTASPTPTMAFPLPPGFALPAGPEPILLENAGQVRELARWPGLEAVKTFLWSPDGKWLALSLESAILFYDGLTLEQVGTILLQETDLHNLVFSSDGNFLAGVSLDSFVSAWKVPTGERIFHQAFRYVDDNPWGGNMEFVPNKPFLAIPTIESGVSLVNLSNGDVNTFKDMYGFSLSPDGDVLATSSYDGSIKLIRLPDGSTLHLFNATAGQVMSAFFSPDGKYLLFQYFDGSNDKRMVNVLRISDGSLVGSMPFEGSPNFGTDVSMLPGGKILLLKSEVDVGENQRKPILQFYRTSDWRPTLRVENDSFAVSPEGTYLASYDRSSSEDRDIKIWRLADSTLQATIPNERNVESAVFSRNDSYLATYDGQFVRILNLDGHEQSRLPEYTSVIEMSFLPDEGGGNLPLLLTTGYQNGVRLWRVADGSPDRTLHEQVENPSQLVFTANGASIAVLSNEVGGLAHFGGCLFNDNYPEEATIDLVRLSDGQLGEPITLKAADEKNPVSFLLYPGGAVGIPHYYSRGSDCPLLIYPTYDQDQQYEIKIPQPASPLAAAFLADGNTFWVADSKGVGYYNITDGSQIRKSRLDWSQSLAKVSSYSRNIVMSPQGNYLLTAVQENQNKQQVLQVDLWDLEYSRYAYRLVDLSEDTSSFGYYFQTNAAFSPDENLVALAWKGQPIQVFHTDGGDKLVEIGGSDTSYKQLAFSTDGKVVIGLTDEGLKLWEVNTRTLLADLPVNTRPSQMILSQDGRYLVTLSGDGLIQLWGVVP